MLIQVLYTLNFTLFEVDVIYDKYSLDIDIRNIINVQILYVIVLLYLFFILYFVYTYVTMDHWS